uniref:START domain-containing protein n=1 Tax=Euplotes harpa TaxID=151035 RepID=A0A7S3NDM1_9SPIT|mmetsp:Transcript_39730/g.45613  ORF Transcript_39730/g.45613 Transcript_39730/m.45613 type:complete len:290 (+) Transcript_39730:16-885(+)|eukprot:CAMPEP_0168330864 /NCGR_PEP_ID=MMETSP0213-20121227/7995_1 /TAXON_ID=151035 /ORGANISM="Euplotes harpa, Strain FSP1.4" /LENGTH=289 /DNA_ID=CAMNT_0008334537 /DNA_START=6 /DNA_END=875 /DNA_ORIENTATION=-
MGQANCCAADSKNDNIVDMDKARKSEEEKQKKREGILKKRESQKKDKKGKKVKNEDEVQKDEEESKKYDLNDIDSLLPEAPTLHDMERNQVNHEMVLTSREKAIKYWDEMFSKEWKLNKEEEGIQIFTRPSESDTQKYTMRVMDLVSNKEYVATYLCNLEKEINAKKGVEKLTVVEDLGFNNKIIYMALKGTILLGSRGFVNCRTKYKLKNGDYLIVSHPVEHKDIPKTKNIRGALESLTWVQQNSDTEIRVTNMLRYDMKGSVPEANMKKLVDEQLAEYAYLKKNLNK